MASRQPLIVTTLCLVLALSSLLSIITGVCAIIRASSSQGDARTKRSATAIKEHQDSFLFRRALHKVSWTSTAKLDPDWRPSEFADVTVADDIFISVKTSEKFHETRLKVILDTWFQLAPNKIWFFSDDSSDVNLSRRTRGHLTNTKCPSSHNRSALCCKMAAEISAFVASRERWFCHFDDDNYVNLPALVKMLNGYDAKEKWYLGKPSIQKPLEVLNRAPALKNRRVKFQFATGGAGFCLSRPLAVQMKPLVDNGELVATCEEIRLPDDVTVGYLAEHVLKTPLTVVKGFHSHLEPLRMIREETFRDQISFSYGQYDTVVDSSDPLAVSNVVGVDGGAKEEDDPTRFYAIHCHLFPDLCTARRTIEP